LAYGGTLGAGVWAIVHGAQTVPRSSIISAFAVPVLVGCFIGVGVRSVLVQIRGQSEESHDPAEIIQQIVVMGSVLFPLSRLVDAGLRPLAALTLVGSGAVMASLCRMLEVLQWAPWQRTLVPPAAPVDGTNENAARITADATD
jgi:hypothetical protein